jgi:hypothetical protein
MRCCVRSSRIVSPPCRPRYRHHFDDTMNSSGIRVVRLRATAVESETQAETTRQR